MRTAGAFFIVVGVAFGVFELPSALAPSDGDVEHGWAVAGAVVAGALAAVGALLMIIDAWRARRR